MNVSLAPELEKVITDRVASGRYHSASEVVREARRLLEQQDELYQARLERFAKRLTSESSNWTGVIVGRLRLIRSDRSRPAASAA